MKLNIIAALCLAAASASAEEETAAITLTTGECRSEFASVTVDPQPNEDGTYESGTSVTVTFVPQDGVTFDGWTGDVADDDKAKASVTVAMDAAKSLQPTFTSTFMVYDKEAGELTDGTWVVKATGEADAIVMGSFSRAFKAAGFSCDLSRPILGGGKIVRIDAPVTGAAYYRLPDTLKTLGGYAFGYANTAWGVSGVTMEPLLPDSVTEIKQYAFAYCSLMKGNLRIGFATDEEGNYVETSIGTGAFVYAYGFGPEVRLGPGVRTIGYSAFCNNAFKNYVDGPFDLYIGPNVQSANGACFDIRGVARSESTTTIGVHFEGDMFQHSASMFMNYDSKTSAHTQVPVPYRMRFYVGEKSHAKWRAFLADTEKVTPWDSLTDEVKEEYWSRFPKNEQYGTEHPYGLTTDAAVILGTGSAASGLPANQWVFSLYEPRGGVLIVR